MSTDIDAPDGRRLEVTAIGDAGPALVFHHGTPMVAESYTPWVDAALTAGLRWVSITRPGYAGSTRHAGRSVADVAADVTAVLDRLDVDRFAAVGWSGGGPHALACGALLAPRCVGVATLAGVAPWDVARGVGFDWLDGMGPENLEEFAAASAGEAELRRFLAAPADGLREVTGEQVAAELGGLVDAADVAVLTGRFADDVAAGFRAAVSTGVDGWVDDDLAFRDPWGFELADVAVPVAVWQGSQDRMVPYAHGRFMAERLPDVRDHLLPGEGHISVALGRFDDLLTELRTFF